MSTGEQAGLGGKGSKHHCSLSSKEEHIGRCPQPAVSEVSYTDQALGGMHNLILMWARGRKTRRPDH